MLRTGIRGEGTYGIIYSAKSSDTNEEFGVKRNLVDPRVSFAGSIRELDLLAKCQSHPHIIPITHISIGSPFNSGCFSPIRGRSDLKDDKLHFIFPLADCNLRELINREKIPFPQAKRYMTEILLGLEYLHSKSIMHRDLKPDNILYISGKLKICDLGLSKPYIKSCRHSPHVVTADYRAPELICDWEDYDYKIDVWSFACIAIKLVSGKDFIICKRDDDKLLIDLITQNMPERIPDSHIKSMSIGAYHMRRFKQKNVKNRLSLYDRLFSNRNDIEESEKEMCVDMISHCLVFKPSERSTVTELLQHPFFTSEMEYIKEVRKDFEPIEDPLPEVKCIVCNERDWGFNILCDYFNDRYDHDWYSHHILFLSMDIYDRYLVHLSETMKECKQTKCHGKYLSKFNAEVHYIVCLYLAIKYYYDSFSFREILPKEFKKDRVYKIAEDLDIKLIRDILKYQIYRPNIYTMSDRILTDEEVVDMLVLVGRLHELDSSLTVKEVYEAYEVARRNKETNNKEE